MAGCRWNPRGRSVGGFNVIPRRSTSFSRSIWFSTSNQRILQQKIPTDDLEGVAQRSESLELSLFLCLVSFSETTSHL
jgi:hypothetical protein